MDQRRKGVHPVHLLLLLLPMRNTLWGRHLPPCRLGRWGTLWGRWPPPLPTSSSSTSRKSPSRTAWSASCYRMRMDPAPCWPSVGWTPPCYTHTYTHTHIYMYAHAHTHTRTRATVRKQTIVCPHIPFLLCHKHTHTHTHTANCLLLSDHIRIHPDYSRFSGRDLMELLGDYLMKKFERVRVPVLPTLLLPVRTHCVSGVWVLLRTQRSPRSSCTLWCPRFPPCWRA